MAIGGCCKDTCSGFGACCDAIVIGVRFVAALAAIGAILLSFMGIQLAIDMITINGDKAFFESYTYREIGFFLCGMGGYITIFSLFVLLAEIRSPCLQRTLLKHFSFLTFYAGRGLFYLFLGSLLAGIDFLMARIVGGTLVLCGLLELLFSACYFPDKSHRRKRRLASARVPAGPAEAPYREADILGRPDGAGGATTTPSASRGGSSRSSDGVAMKSISIGDPAHGASDAI